MARGPTRSKKSTDDTLGSPEDVAGVAADVNPEVSGDAMVAEYTEVSAEQAAPAAGGRRTRQARRRAKSRPDDLAARAAAEDVWVRADLRRIGVVSAILVAGLAVAWVVFVMLDVLGLY